MRLLDKIATALGMCLWWFSTCTVYIGYVVVNNKLAIVDEQSTQALLDYLNSTC